MITLSSRFNQQWPSVIKFLDSPTMWIIYLITGLYIFFFGLVITRGMVKYNEVLDVVEKQNITSIHQSETLLKSHGFNNSLNEYPSLLDYFYAGL